MVVPNGRRFTKFETMKAKIFYGWQVVIACFVIACFSWGLGLFGSSVYLQAVTTAHGWSITQVSSAITVFLFVSAAGQRTLGRSIGRYGPRTALLMGATCICIGVVSIGLVTSVVATLSQLRPTRHRMGDAFDDWHLRDRRSVV